MNAPSEAQVVASATAFSNWKLAREADGIAVLTFDKAGASTNTLSAAVLAELNGVLDVQHDQALGTFGTDKTVSAGAALEIENQRRFIQQFFLLIHEIKQPSYELIGLGVDAGRGPDRADSLFEGLDRLLYVRSSLRAVERFIKQLEGIDQEPVAFFKAFRIDRDPGRRTSGEV